jgi:hypothetical protein
LDLGGNTLINNGTVSPGASPGTLVIAGNYTQSPTGILAIELAGTQQGVTYDLLQITGIANLGGTLNVTNSGGFSPVPGNIFDIMTFAGRTGDFSSINLPAGSNLLVFNGPNFYELFMSPPAFVLVDAINPVLVEENHYFEQTRPQIMIEEPTFRRPAQECS